MPTGFSASLATFSIFSQTAALLLGEGYALPTIEERFDTAMRQICDMVEHKGMLELLKKN